MDLQEYDENTDSMTIGALVDLRDQLIDPLKPQTDLNIELLVSVDTLLHKLINKLIKL